MAWASLNLWADEERRIHQCLTESLQKLIATRAVLSVHEEKPITGLLRPILKRVCKNKKLDWTLHPEAASFAQEDDPEPVAYPDIRFSRLDPDYNQYDYDVECKLVRIKRPDTRTDYCYNYVNKGVLRYRKGKYAQSFPPMGTMLGYIQEGELLTLLDTINAKAKHQMLNEIKLTGEFTSGGVSYLTQYLHRDTDDLVLSHLWADFR